MNPVTPFPSRSPEPPEDSISYVTAIAALTGVAPHLIALASHQLLGGVAGHHSWIEGAAAEVVRPGYSLIVAGGDDPRWQRALELLTAPLLACQNRSREVSRGCRADVWRAELAADNKLTESRNLVRGDVINSPFAGGVAVSLNRRFDVLAKPLVLLEAPDHPSYVAGMKEAMDREALILYRDGRLLEQSLVQRPSAPANQLIQALAAAVDGCTEHVPDKTRVVDLCEMERTQVSLHLSASPQVVRAALLSAGPAISRLMASCLILPVKFTTDRPLCSRTQLNGGYDQWRRMVTDVFTARHNGGGMRFQLDDNHHAALLAFNQDLLTRLAETPGPLRAYFRPLPALPYRLMWGMMAASRWGGQREVESTIELTHWAFEQQLSLLDGVAAGNSVVDRAAFKDQVWEKLKLKAPCTRRTLVRCFTTQRIEIFAPVLQELADEQRIRCPEGGLIELLDLPALQEARSRS